MSNWLQCHAHAMLSVLVLDVAGLAEGWLGTLPGAAEHVLS